MNRFPNNLGFHITADTEEVRKSLAVTKTFQFFVSSPKSWDRPSRAILQRIGNMIREWDITPVIHGPYMVSLVRDAKPAVVEFTINYAIQLFISLTEYTNKAIPYVLHTGKPEENCGPEVRDRLVKNLLLMKKKIDETGLLNAYVCVETDASPRSKYTNMAGLSSVMEEINDPRFKICVDTEHSYASGFDVAAEATEEMWDRVGVLHLNAIPEAVKFGSGLDRHSETKLRECSKGGQYIKPAVSAAIKRNLPIILERDPMDVIIDDIGFVSECDLSAKGVVGVVGGSYELELK